MSKENENSRFRRELCFPRQSSPLQHQHRDTNGLYLQALVNTAPSAVPEHGQVAASLLLLGSIGGYAFVKLRKAAKARLVPFTA